MQLKLKRSQTTSGLLSKSAVFCLDARAELTAEERHHVGKYNLGKEVLYTSEAHKKHAEQAMLAASTQSVGGALKGLARTAMAKMSLVITVDSLTRGQHIECKDLAEIMGAEEALMEACQNIKAYLDTAVTFDGREQVLEF